MPPKGYNKKAIFKNCFICGKEFKTYKCWIKRGGGRGKYCSRKCSDISKRGKPSWNKGKKGSQVAWNKGMKGYTNAGSFKFKTGKTFNNGYLCIYKPEHPFAHCGYIRKHRLIVEQQIGRYLLPYEDVHHLGTKNDNRPHMLMAFSSHSAHIRFERKIKIKPSEIIFDGRKLNN